MAAISGALCRRASSYARRTAMVEHKSVLSHRPRGLHSLSSVVGSSTDRSHLSALGASLKRDTYTNKPSIRPKEPSLKGMDAMDASRIIEAVAQVKYPPNSKEALRAAEKLRELEEAAAAADDAHSAGSETDIKLGDELSVESRSKISLQQNALGLPQEEIDKHGDLVSKVVSFANCPRRDLNKQRIREIVKLSQRHETDVGSSEVQVATLTFKINTMREHFRLHHKDYSSGRGLQAMLTRRRKMLAHLRRSNFERYNWLVQKLNLPVVEHETRQIIEERRAERLAVEGPVKQNARKVRRQAKQKAKAKGRA